MTDKHSHDEDGGFHGLGLDLRLIETLETLGYEEPTPIQRASIPQLLEGKDFMGQAATGTGKTAAFALPVLQRIAALGKGRPKPSALVLVPTRELAMQVAEAVHRYGRPLNINVIPIYGGHSFGQQLRALERGIDVVVATPGRALDHIRRQTLRLDGVSIVVLDEADEMLDMGFAEDLEAILQETPRERQTVLFSATLPPRITAMSRRHLSDPVRIQIATEKLVKGAAPKVRQIAFIVQRANKLVALSRVLDLENPASALVFCRTRVEVDELTNRLTARGYRAQPLHGGISQDQRSRVVKQLRSGEVDLVIATDVAARGLDIEQLSHVVNYDVPTNPESYVHRIGRVGRAGREGVAITLVEPRESRLLRSFEQLGKQKIQIAQVPTIADLRARRLEMTRVALQEALLAGDLDQYRVVVETLAAEHSPIDVALAAVKLAHQAAGGDEAEEDIVAFVPKRDRSGDERGGKPRPVKDKDKDKGAKRKAGGAGGDRRDRAAGKASMARLYIGAGRTKGIRPQDLVGAIAGEADIRGRDVGAIDIGDYHSIVEVPEALADRVIKALKGSNIKGKKVVVRRFRD
jgi:ATP-dependent RNA helicase DeaD